ncbi:hypothetical protein [Halorarum salinum]|uniref:Uncharacterized protein n=1 Tax=Halorarum salinum TaxID=2743089 RepID=A0A7D5L9N9_9EURY|nr:hypothetical protein [Halobaculum salinum]QLG60989.1 hypothetical protein HUG12_04255 [Halobaculum salinum]
MADDSTHSLGPNHGPTRVPHMGAAGWIVAAGSAFLLLPVLPFLALYYLFASTDGRPN